MPFVATTLTGLAVSTYLVFFCPPWLSDLMQLTEMPTSFKFLLMGAVLVGFLFSVTGEQHIFPRFTQILKLRLAKLQEGAKRKKYKVTEEQMRF